MSYASVSKTRAASTAQGQPPSAVQPPRQLYYGVSDCKIRMFGRVYLQVLPVMNSAVAVC